MAELSQEQVEKRSSIQKSATTWGAILGVVAGLLTYWVLGGQGGAVRFGGAVVAAVAIGYLVFRSSFNAQAKTARCASCGAAFSRSRTDRAETLVSATPEETREKQEDGSTRVTSWTEETVDVVDTYTCATCGDVTTAAYQTTRRRDETTTVTPAPVPKGWARTEPADDAAVATVASAPSEDAGAEAAPRQADDGGEAPAPRGRGRRR